MPSPRDRFNFTLSSEEDKQLDVLANGYGISRSAVLGMAIRGILPPLARTTLAVNLEEHEVLYLASVLDNIVTGKDASETAKGLRSNLDLLRQQIHQSNGAVPAKLYPCKSRCIALVRFAGMAKEEPDRQVSVPCILAEGHKKNHRSEGAKSVTWKEEEQLVKAPQGWEPPV